MLALVLALELVLALVLALELVLVFVFGLVEKRETFARFINLSFIIILSKKKDNKKGEINMETIIKKYIYLPPEQFGSIVKIIIEYSETGQINGNTRDIAFFKMYIKNDVDKMLKARKRALKNIKKKKENKK